MSFQEVFAIRTIYDYFNGLAVPLTTQHPHQA